MSRMLTLAVLAVLMMGGIAQARPNYQKALFAMYPDNKAIAEAKCKTCHGDDKKVRNDFGKAVGGALGAAKVMEEDKVNEALKKAAGEKGSEGKTFGEQLKAGALPK